MAVTFSSVKADDCSDPSARLNYKITGGGPRVRFCQAYVLLTQDSRNQENYFCDSDSKFIDLAERPEWSYDVAADAWTSTQPLTGNAQIYPAIPGSYTVTFKSSDGAVMQNVNYALRDPGGDPNVCQKILQNPAPGIYPLTIVSPANFAGTYSSYSDFAAKVSALGYASSCVLVDGVVAYGPSAFPPCLQLTSNSPQATPTPTTTPTPTPTATATPTPTQTVPAPPPSGSFCTNSAGQSVSIPSNIKMQPLWFGGTNNYVFDSYNYTNTGRPGINPATAPQNTIQVFPLPTTDLAGSPLNSLDIAYASFIYNAIGVQYEVSFSRCPGDFSYYHTPQSSVQAFGQTLYPCGGVYGTDFQIAATYGDGTFSSCGIPNGEQWYMNWRVLPGTCQRPDGSTCALTFTVHGS